MVAARPRSEGIVNRPRGYLTAYAPRTKTRALLDAVRVVLVEYEAQKPLTVRQIFYRLVGTIGYPKDERAYAQLAEHIGNARRARVIPFADIRDDGVAGGAPQHWRDAGEFRRAMRRTAERAELDVMATQPLYVEVLCEAAGMLPQLQAVAYRYSISVYSSGGFDSLTAKKETADRIVAAGKPAVVLHLGDYDPSGVSIFDALAADVSAFLAADAPDAPIEFSRVALTREQVGRYALPTSPPKRTDSRSSGWSETCQLEALAPDALASIFDAALCERLDMDHVQARQTDTATLRRSLLLTLGEPA